MSLAELLGYAGDVLDTPGSMVRGALAGQNPLAGILDPEQRISGRGLLEQWGMLDPKAEGEGFGLGDLAGLGAGIATDPLTYAGGAAAKYLGGKLVGMLGKGKSVGESAASMLPLRRDFTVLNDVRPTVGQQLSRVQEMAKTPLEQFGYSVDPKRYLGPSLGDLVDDSTAMEGYLQTGYTGAGKPGINVVGRPVGSTQAKTATGTAARAREMRGELRDASEMMIPGLGGYYNPADRAAVVYGQKPAGMALQEAMGGVHFSPSEVRRHEVSHGLVDRAMAAGRPESLPLPQHVAASLRMQPSETLQGFGSLADELAAREAGGAGEAMSFLRNPQPGYEKHFREFSPLVADIYGQSMIPRAPGALAVALGAVPAGAGAYYLGNKMYPE